MITVRLTENYGGFQIEGDFDDLNQFYDDLGSVMGYEESQDDGLETQRLQILGLMYDIRHAYQGDRIVKLNGEAFCARADDPNRDSMLGLRYAFNYYLLDFLADYIIIRSKLFPMKKSTYDGEYEDLTSAHYRIVNVFAQAVEQLATILTPIQANKVKRFLDMASKMGFTAYHRFWLEDISTDYLKMTPKQRKQNIMRSINALCEFYHYDDFYNMRRSIDSYIEKNHCDIGRIRLADESAYENVLW